MTKFRVLSLFAGIGGFDLGLERTGGFSTVAFCEIEPFCQRVLKKHWPEVPCYEDVRELTAERLHTDGIFPNFITAGFPCQDASVANAGGLGTAGERTGLFRDVVRLAGDLGVRGILMENVANLLNRGFGDVLGALAEIGYDAEWHCIPASSIGAPHPRERIWIVAHPNEVCGERHYFASLGQQLASRWQAFGELGAPDWWDAEPELGRVVYGVPSRLDKERIAALGNAVVPQIPELLGRAWMEAQA